MQNMFNNNGKKKPVKPWVPFVFVVGMAILLILISYFMMDVVNSLY